jgi:hypothetical protein
MIWGDEFLAPRDRWPTRERISRMTRRQLEHVAYAFSLNSDALAFDFIFGDLQSIRTRLCTLLYPPTRPPQKRPIKRRRPR